MWSPNGNENPAGSSDRARTQGLSNNSRVSRQLVRAQPTTQNERDSMPRVTSNPVGLVVRQEFTIAAKARAAALSRESNPLQHPGQLVRAQPTTQNERDSMPRATSNPVGLVIRRECTITPMDRAAALSRCSNSPQHPVQTQRRWEQIGCQRLGYHPIVSSPPHIPGVSSPRHLPAFNSPGLPPIYSSSFRSSLRSSPLFSQYVRNRGEDFGDPFQLPIAFAVPSPIEMTMEMSLEELETVRMPSEEPQTFGMRMPMDSDELQMFRRPMRMPSEELRTLTNMMAPGIEEGDDSSIMKCRNDGCNDAYPISEAVKHSITCEKRIFPCPFRYVSSCSWSGVKSSLVAHCLDSHPANLTFDDEFSFNLDIRILDIKVYLVKAYESLLFVAVFLDYGTQQVIGLVKQLGQCVESNQFLASISFGSIAREPRASIVYCRKPLVETTLNNSFFWMTHIAPFKMSLTSFRDLAIDGRVPVTVKIEKVTFAAESTTN